MGVGGAAIATVLGNVFALVYYINRYASGKTILKLRPSLFSWDKIILKEIVAIGTPASLSQVLMSVSMVFSNNIAAGYNDLVVAGYGVSLKIMTIGTFIFMGFAAGAQPLVGYNYGAKNYARVKEIVMKGLQITSTIGIVLTGLFLVAAPQIIAFFVPSSEVVALGTVILRALVLSLPFAGGVMICSTTVQSMGKAKQALWLSVSRQGLIYIPLVLIANMTFGMAGFIYAQPVTDAIMFILSIMVFRGIKFDGNDGIKGNKTMEMVEEIM